MSRSKEKASISGLLYPPLTRGSMKERRMRINGFTSLTATNRLEQTSRAIARSIARLSAGKRVMNPQDDVASFSVAQKLNSKIRGLSQASLNINQGKGIFETLSVGINSQIEIVQRMRELAVQASNGLLSSADRNGLQSELLSLREQFDALVDNTEFNGQKLLNGSLNSIELQVGANLSDQISFDFSSLKSTDVFKINEGTGNFQVTASTALTGGNRQADAADLDGDGNLDVISPSRNSGGAVDILFGDGEGGFDRVTHLADAEVNIDDVSIADFNGDGILDFVTANRDSDSISIYLGNGDGSFQSRFTLAEDDRVFRVVTGDFNGDGIEDIASSILDTGSSSTLVSLRLGNGDGTFGSSTTYSIGSGTVQEYDLAAGDLNNDGIEDIIITADQGGASTDLSFLLGATDGTLTESLSTIVLNRRGSAITVGDFNRDGNLDVVSYNTSSIVGPGPDIYAFLGDGAGGVSSTVTTTLSGSQTGFQLQVGDFNSDGFLDLFQVGNNVSRTLLGDGTGAFDTTSIFSPSGVNRGGVVGDFNNDGVSDVAYSSTTDNVMRIVLNQTRLASALSSFDLMTTEKAQDLIDILDGSLERLLKAQSEVSTHLTRLDHAANLNMLFSESILEAKSLIEDLDITIEISELVRNQILQQSQVAVLAQANTNAQIVLGLLDSLSP